ncbi:hypothetical protein EXU29_12405 [Acinetobacter wuhouensis]|uniref:hypothetical protein n=1 Tax=Acinetobacter wuhouensis TaxID=1879050 RepID=UPI001023A26D|nr:hypothetical protein [Acinetobacter wuhouensis]RZG71918.1 hypothetical protein EXU29_12405 [Acinetobacter wuhouensis]
MVAESNVQFICSDNLGAPVVTDSWGSLISALNTALVSGLLLPSVNLTSIDNGVMKITFSATHKLKLFQVVDLIGFTPESLNGKWRIIGVEDNQSISIDCNATVVSSVGSVSVSALGYDKVFEGTNKSVYRCKDTEKQYRPFLRFDCSQPSNYVATTAKFARVGLMTECTSIDDVASGITLPFDPSKPDENWVSTGSGTAATTFWAKWVYSEERLSSANSDATFQYATTGNKKWTIIGDDQAFYLIIASSNNKPTLKQVYGIGVYDKLRPTEFPYFIGCVPFRGVLSGYTYINETATEGQGLYPWRGWVYAAATSTQATLCNGEVTSRVLVTNKNGNTEYSGTQFGKDTPYAAVDGPTLTDQYITNGYRGRFKHIKHSLTNLNSSEDFKTMSFDGGMFLIEPSAFKGIMGTASTVHGIPFYLGGL